MISYSESEIFSGKEYYLLCQATFMVKSIEERLYCGRVIRCHELTRAVGELLELQVQDGFYGFVDHSWLWTRPVDTNRTPTARLGFPHILDVYAVGRLPQVTLVAGDSPSLPHVGWSYRPGTARTDIDLGVVEMLKQGMKRP